MKVEIMTVDVPNKNGHIYPRSELERVISKYQGKSIAGMLGMPGFDEMAAVDVKRLSHRIENLRLEGDVLVGDLVVLKTPYGNIVQQLIDEHVLPDFRTAGTGNLRQVGDHAEITDYVLHSINAVNDGA